MIKHLLTQGLFKRGKKKILFSSLDHSHHWKGSPHPIMVLKACFLSSILSFLPNVRVCFSFFHLDITVFMISDFFFPLLNPVPDLSSYEIRITVVLLDCWGHFLGDIYRYKRFPLDSSYRLHSTIMHVGQLNGKTSLMWCGRQKGNSPWIGKEMNHQRWDKCVQ